MIERLVIALRALGGSADEQLARFPEFGGKPHEVALEFDDAYLLLRQCQQLELSAGERDAVAAVDRLLDHMRHPEHRDLWTEQAVRGAPEWERLRGAARAALRALGYAERQAPL